MHRFAVSVSRLLLALHLLSCCRAVLLKGCLRKRSSRACDPRHRSNAVGLGSALGTSRHLPYQARAPIGGAAVQWDGAILAIHASGEDLPGILTEVARATGLKVTGGVPDERVFGTYGPGPVQQVLADLFNGLYVNLLLVNGTETQPKELILTPRTGGPTPPSPARSIEAFEQPTAHRHDRPYRGVPPPGLGLAAANGPPLRRRRPSFPALPNATAIRPTRTGSRNRPTAFAPPSRSSRNCASGRRRNRAARPASNDCESCHQAIARKVREHLRCASTSSRSFRTSLRARCAMESWRVRSGRASRRSARSICAASPMTATAPSTIARSAAAKAWC